MPYGDGTGPLGYGPRTGRGAGFCNGWPVPGYLNNAVPRMGRGYGGGWGRGWGCGWGRGWGAGWGKGGFGYGYSPGYYGPKADVESYPPSGAIPSKEDEIGYLERFSKTLERELKGVKARLEALRGKKEKEE